MSSMPNLNEIKTYYLSLNRTLTLALVAMLVCVSAFIWYTDAISIQSSSSVIGLSFMFMAVVFYKLPHISYLLIRRRYKNVQNLQGVEILASDWKTFKSWVQS